MPTDKPNKKTVILLALFVLLFATSLFIYKDYGIAWDEPQQRELGLRTYNYLFHGDDSLLEFKDRHYGVAFELPLIFIEKSLDLEDSRSIYLMRHLVSHLFFIIGVMFFFLILLKQFGNYRLAMAGALFLLLSPVIFAHSFFNSKDIPFMVMFVISQFTLLQAVRSRPVVFILHGVVTGLLMNIRIMGVIMVALTFLFILLKYLQDKDLKRMFVSSLIFLFSAVIILFVTWPYLWTDPAGHFLEAFTVMRQFNWDDPVLYFGQMIPATEVPWHYIPGWIGITTPLLYLLLAVTGFIMLAGAVIRNPVSFIKTDQQSGQLLFLLAFLGPLLAVVILKSVLYDGWRQMFFIYPSLLYMAIYGLDRIFMKISRFPLLKYALTGIIVIQLAWALDIMIRIHPFQQVYFNILVSHKDGHIRQRFEMDYWGTSYKQALEHILMHDDSDTIRVTASNTPGWINSSIISIEAGRHRIEYVNTVDKADYFITNYRWHPEDYPYDKPWHNIRVMGSDMNTTWKFGDAAGKVGY